ncbi:ABC transporter ATP-binding protein [Clostridium sp. JN-9]|uniref:ABC transporter ATP-binding protein n=1 Tax=Clostridium sp. JN-9 TaxID=2507159 RepID=UPI000FFE2D03|nr:ABC transporter ATP-binding protein [Clostridium sp. JN-9]QAT39790.1 ABC transporter ATP-binding protein [Clostridium sp. JN-9]
MYKYLIKYKILFITSICLIITSSIFEIIKAFIFGRIFDIITLKQFEQFKMFIFYTALFLVLKFTISFLRDYSYGVLTKKSLVLIKKSYFSGVLNKNLEDFGKEDSSKYLSSLTNDINILNNDFFKSLKEIVGSLSCFVFSIIVMWRVNVWYVVISLSLSTIPFLIAMLMSKKQITVKTNYSSQLSAFVSKTKEYLTGFETIKNYGIEEKIKNSFNIQNNNLEQAFLANNKVEYFIENITGFVLSSTFFTAMFFGGYLVISGSITLGTMMTVTQVMNYIIDPLDLFTVCTNKIRSLKTIWGNITSIIDYSNVKDSSNKIDTIHTSIKLNNVSFGYSRTNKILKNINLEFEKGKKYAIVGESGCGKSTLIKLISKYYNNYEGDIIVNNMNLNTISYSSWRENFSIITQNIFMFNDTIENNITLCSKFDKSDIEYVINESGLDETIGEMKNGLNTMVKENGYNLSGGQKQRIAIARGLIRNPSLLILDEMSSALDSKTSYDIESNILNLNDVTVIVVTHKLNTDLLKKYDKIIVMDKGEIEEEGSFDELVECNGTLTKLLAY